MKMRTLDKEHNFLGLDAEWSDPARARVVVLPIPYEQTSSYIEGSARGPDAILEASRQVELYDEECGDEPYRWTDGIATLEAPALKDAGGREAVERIADSVESLVAAGKFVVCLGGEHTIAVGSAQGHHRRVPGLSILQMDAHADLRESYEGDAYSHACAMARIREFNPRIAQIGIRSLSAPEGSLIREKNISTLFAHEMPATGPEAWFQRLSPALSENVYLTIDCDYFDPSVFPAVGTPEPGGPGWNESLAFLRALVRNRRVVGFDVNELCPAAGSIRTEFAAARLIYKLVGWVFKA